MSTALERLGEGTDGAVWLSSDRTAVKAFYLTEQFEVERKCYQRLHAEDVSEIRGFAVPCLLDYSKGLRVIEMTTVILPCLLDFGKAYLDRKPDFSSLRTFCRQTGIPACKGFHRDDH